MKTLLRVTALLITLATTLAVVLPPPSEPAATTTAPTTQPVRFEPLDVFIDTPAPLAAYQFEVAVEQGQATIVGVEGGTHKAFADAPYYDPAALQQNRIIVAAFNTGKDLPSGKTRVARLHMRIAGNAPQYALKLIVATDSNGDTIPATATVARAQGEAK